MYKNLLTWDTDLYKFFTARINAFKICKEIYTSFGRHPIIENSGTGQFLGGRVLKTPCEQHLRLLAHRV